MSPNDPKKLSRREALETLGGALSEWSKSHHERERQRLLGRDAVRDGGADRRHDQRIHRDPDDQDRGL